jgi:hypothetical protein
MALGDRLRTDHPTYDDLPPVPGGGRSAWRVLGDGNDRCRRVFECFLVSAPLHLPGGIWSSANAIAIK